jgi:hypothetical protein
MTVESAIVRAFIKPSRRRRMLTLLETEKGRAKATLLLAHSIELDPRYSSRITGTQRKAPIIAATLTQLGAPIECYAWSELDTVDGRTLGLEEALEEVVGRGFGTFLSCLPGRLAYFEGEAPGERYICHRPR